MSSAMWIAVIICALGTLLMRVVPFLWMQRRLGSATGMNAMPQWLVILGPMMIAAVLGVSIVPVNPSLLVGHRDWPERYAVGVASPALTGLAGGRRGGSIWGGGGSGSPYLIMLCISFYNMP